MAFDLATNLWPGFVSVVVLFVATWCQDTTASRAFVIEPGTSREVAGEALERATFQAQYARGHDIG